MSSVPAVEGYSSQTECALRAARRTAGLLRCEFHRGLKEEIDVHADQAIFDILTHEFPLYGYHSEELGLKLLPRDEGRHLWLVDPHDGTNAAARGFRGASVSIALLRDGRLVLGVVLAYCAPDDHGDTFWWSEGLAAIYRNGSSINRTWPREVSNANTVLVSQDADSKAELNAELAEPMRYRGVPGIAYRLALVAAGEGDAAVTINQPVGWDMAGGHALLLASGGDLFDAAGTPVAYDRTGSIRKASGSAFFGGHHSLIRPLLQRDWMRLLRPSTKPSSAKSLCFLVPGKTVPEPDILGRAQGCLLGQLAGDALGSLVEFDSASAIRKRYPNGPRLLEDGGTWFIRGQVRGCDAAPPANGQSDFSTEANHP